MPLQHLQRGDGILKRGPSPRRGGDVVGGFLNLWGNWDVGLGGEAEEGLGEVGGVGEGGLGVPEVFGVGVEGLDGEEGGEIPGVGGGERREEWREGLLEAKFPVDQGAEAWAELVYGEVDGGWVSSQSKERVVNEVRGGGDILVSLWICVAWMELGVEVRAPGKKSVYLSRAVRASLCINICTEYEVSPAVTSTC